MWNDHFEKKATRLLYKKRVNVKLEKDYFVGTDS